MVTMARADVGQSGSGLETSSHGDVNIGGRTGNTMSANVHYKGCSNLPKLEKNS